jgi:hypothetical protein
MNQSNLMHLRTLAVGAFVVALLTRGLSATVVIPPTFEQLVAGADLVFEGRVVDVRSQFETSGGGQAITTKVSFSVMKLLKGSSPAIAVLDFLGGTVGNRTYVVDGIPRFSIGDRDVLFVNTTRRFVSPLVGFSHGRFRVAADPAGGQDRVYRFDGVPVTVAQIGIVAATPSRVRVPVSVAEFEGAITTEMARQAKGLQR